MGWRTTGDVAEFLAAAGEYLRSERARNTIVLTVTETMRANPARYRELPDGERDLARAPLFGWWTDQAGEVRGGFLHTPPFPLLLTAVPPPAAADLAGTLARGGRPLPGVNADPVVAEAFAGFWRQETGCDAEVRVRERLYRLAELSRPDPAPAGAPRVADVSDTDLLTDWFTAFGRETAAPGDQGQAAAVAERLSYRGITVWETGGGPVSVAGLTRQVAGMVRVGPVYTPPEFRGRGYASAVTAAVSQQGLDSGVAEVLLYTDLANPVSNSIYQRIGYRPVEDRLVLEFRTCLSSQPMRPKAGCGYRCAVIEQTVSYALLKAMKSTRGAISPVLAECGLHPGQDLLLSALWLEDGIAQTALAARLGIEAPTVSRALERLERAGYVRRESGRGRSRCVYLTEQGRALRRPVEQAWADADSELADRIGEGDLTELSRILSRLTSK